MICLSDRDVCARARYPERGASGSCCLFTFTLPHAATLDRVVFVRRRMVGVSCARFPVLCSLRAMFYATLTFIPFTVGAVLLAALSDNMETDSMEQHDSAR